MAAFPAVLKAAMLPGEPALEPRPMPRPMRHRKDRAPAAAGAPAGRPDPPARQAAPPRDSSRLEGFSDAVFGFSATLLVVTLDVPQTFPDLVASLWGFLPFSLSFLALALLWSTHHAFFRRYGMADRVTIALNAILLFVIVFYVYPLKFMTTSLFEDVFARRPFEQSLRFRGPDDVAGMFLVYGMGFAAIFACFALLYRHAARSAHHLGLAPEQLHEARMLSRHYWILCAVGLFSMALAAGGVGLRWGVPGFAYALIGPLTWWHGHWSGLRLRRPPGRVALERSTAAS